VKEDFVDDAFSEFVARPCTLVHRPTRRSWPDYWFARFTYEVPTREDARGDEPYLTEQNGLPLYLGEKVKTALEALEMPAIVFERSVVKLKAK
jgi:hypothetical protein